MNKLRRKMQLCRIITCGGSFHVNPNISIKLGVWLDSGRIKENAICLNSKDKILFFFQTNKKRKKTKRKEKSYWKKLHVQSHVSCSQDLPNKIILFLCQIYLSYSINYHRLNTFAKKIKKPQIK